MGSDGTLLPFVARPGGRAAPPAAGGKVLNAAFNTF
jgi:hypothetical protein